MQLPKNDSTAIYLLAIPEGARQDARLVWGVKAEMRGLVLQKLPPKAVQTSFPPVDKERTMIQNHFAIVSSALVAFVLLFPCSITAKSAKPPKPAKPIVVRIDDVVDGAPVVTVKWEPNGYDVYTGPDIADPAIEDGGLITLFGVDQFGSINASENGWRFVDPTLPSDAPRNATDVVWIQHDWAGNGDLQIGFNCSKTGTYYRNPIYTSDANAGPATNQWVTVYSDDTIVVEFKARTP
jgi:hypothetical protein